MTNSENSSAVKPLPSQPSQTEHEFVSEGLAPLLSSLAHKHSTTSEYYSAVFRLAIRELRPINAVFNIRIGTEFLRKQFTSDHETVEARLIASVEHAEQMLQEVQGESSSHLRTVRCPTTQKEYTFLSTPVIDPSEPKSPGTLVTIYEASVQQVQSRASEANELLALASLYATQDVVRSKPTGNTVDKSLDALARSSKYGSLREFSFALVNNLCNKFQCEQVSVGTFKKGAAQVVAVSGISKFKENGPGIADIQQAMEEAADFCEPLVANPAGRRHSDAEFPLHRQWSANTHSPVASIPLMVDNECIAVLSFRRGARDSFRKSDTDAIVANIQPFAQVFQMLDRSEQNLRQHFAASVKQQAQKTFQPKTVPARIVLAVVTVFCLWFLFGWATYRPTCSSTLVPSNMNHSLAAFDMKLKEAHVRAGDRVQAGQILAAFNTEELELESDTLKAEMAKAEVEVRHAIDSGDVAAAALAKARVGLIKTKLDAIQQKITLCTIRAPADGMIVQADLEKRIGQIFPQGEPILSFAPMNAWEIELYIPEHIVVHVQNERAGVFSPMSRPDEGIPYRVFQMSGAAQVVDGKNVVVARAKLDRAETWMRGGMKGVAKTDLGKKPVRWIAFHRLFERMHHSFWF